MQDLLEYVKNLIQAPTGDKLTATHKLALAFIILEGEGEVIELDADKLAFNVLLTNTKSLYKILRELKAGNLLLIEPRKDAGGHPIPSLVYPLPELARIPKNPSNPQITRENPSNLQTTPSNLRMPPGEPSNPQTTPSNPQITRLKLVENKGVSGEMGENPPGIEFALKTLPLNTELSEGGRADKEKEPSNPQITRESLVNNPYVKKWLEMINEELAESGARLIVKRVSNLQAWEDTLEEWLANPRWGKHNVGGQLDRYDKKIRGGNYSQELPVKEALPEETQENKQKQEELKKLIYGD